MPAALPADWTSLKIMAMQGSTLEELSEMSGIALGTLCARSAREGWKEKPKQATEERQSKQVAVAMANGQMQERARSGAELLKSEIASNVGKGRLGLSKWARKAGEHLATLDGEEALAAHQGAASVATVVSKLDPVQAAQSGVVINIALLGMDLPEHSAQVTDI